ncbi:putative linoleate 13S-lipoxygenase [Helianthus annuus]|uniref:Linoleate 13S-lipoxygenase n=1 Tax=Helianthus annuus TaxID=4232 RepID=A0A9K3HXI1_HELAN|nr:putative linoleate 13S-lipoxygenase [Helianthus annuus]
MGDGKNICFVAYLPSSTPKLLLHYRNQELINLRGTGSGMLKEWDRVYDYAYYNDLGAPDRGLKYIRPVLGGNEEFPYPRRGRTGRGPTKTDPDSEKRLCLLNLNIYVPRDERFSHIKFSDFSAYAAKSIGQVIQAEFRAIFDKTPTEFDSFRDIMKLYGDAPKNAAKKMRKNINLEFVRELLRNDGEKLFKFPKPDVLKDNESAWRTDQEFGREMVAGVNPVVIRRLEKFPPASKLDPNKYGDQTSSMTEEHLKPNMNGLTIEEVRMKSNHEFSNLLVINTSHGYNLLL